MRTKSAIAIDAGVAPWGLPGTAPAARAELQLGYGPLELGLGGGAILTSAKTDTNGVGAEASLAFAAIALRATPWRRLTLGTSFEIGKLDAQGVGVGLPRQESLQWQAIGGSLRVGGPRWGKVRTAVTAEVAVPLANLALQVNGSTRFETGPIVRLWLGAVLPFL